MKRVVIILLILLPFFLNGQIITTIGGTGSSVYSGDNGPATTAGITNPCFGAFDKYGNYYFSDASANRVRKIDTTGIITTIAGNGMGSFFGDDGPATAAKINRPAGLKLDTSENVYFVDGINNRIRKVNVSTGIITTIAGTGTGAFGGDNTPATAAEIWDPQDVAVDRRGNIYISDLFNYRVRKIDASGIITTYAGTGIAGFSGDGFPATAAELDFPTGLAVDDIGNLYIADPGSFVNRVRKVDTAGIITTVAGSASGIYIGDEIPATTAAISPYAVALDSFNNLFIADQYNQRVYKVDGAGIIYNVAGNGVAGDGGDGSPATAASVNYPVGVAIDACGNLYIPTVGDGKIIGAGRRIRKVTFNPTCDPYHGAIVSDSVSLNVATITLSGINIYPNPGTTSIAITAANKITQITINNLIGQAIYNQPYDKEKTEINISSFPQGVYIVKVTDAEGQKTITKIIKQ